MQIQAINPNIVNQKSIYLPQKQATKNLTGYSRNEVSLPAAGSLSFLGASPKLLKAKAYLETVKPKGGFDNLKTDVYKLDLNKLDGIQDGIKVFEGMNIKDIAFISRTVLSTNSVRGCHNMCSHCYADALPPKAETGEMINKMSWEDFKSLTDGYKELHDRLGFHISAPNIEGAGRSRYIAPFHDSDTMDVVLKDNNGKEHYATEIISELSDATGIKGLFDTTGWTVTNQKLQQRAEDYVDYYSKPENFKKMHNINISINPFHALYTRSVMERRAGNIEKADKFRDIYTDRIANAIYTFTPLMKTGKMNFIARAFNPESIGEVGKGFTVNDLQGLSDEILNKVRQKYIDDLSGERKIIKTPDKVKSYTKEIKKLINQQVSDGMTLFEEGRGFKTFGNNECTKTTKEVTNQYAEFIKGAKNVKDLYEGDLNGIIDSNGKYYITTYFSTYPTELQFNFANKNKKTAPIKPALQEDLVITRNVINNV